MVIRFDYETREYNQKESHMKSSRLYVGLDVHKAVTVIAVLNAEGKQTMQLLVETKADTIINAIRALSGAIHLVFEEGIHSAWLYDLLQPYVVELVVCDPRKNNFKGNKSDDKDAYRLALRLRAGDLKAVYKGEHGLKTLKELACVYQDLVRDCTRSKNRIKAIFRARAIDNDGTLPYHAEKRQLFLAQLSEPGVQLRAALLYQQLDALVPLVEQAHQAMIKEARKHPAYPILDSIPQFGPIRTALTLAMMLTPFRFRTRRQLWAYSGFAVVTSSSADYEVDKGKIKRTKRPPQTRGLNKNYNRTLKSVFKSAATAATTGVLKEYYDALLAKGTSEKMARLTLARKIASVVLTLWKTGVPFDAKIFLAA